MAVLDLKEGVLQCLERSVSNANVSLKFEFAGLLCVYNIELKRARDEAQKREEIRNGNPLPFPGLYSVKFEVH